MVEQIEQAEKCLAFIWPIESYLDKETAMCNVLFYNGSFAKKVISTVLTTGIYKYYFYGVTFEVVKVTKDMRIVEVHDVSEEEVREFGLSISHAITFNDITHDCLMSNGFLYKLDQSIFYNHFRAVYENMVRYMCCSRNFVLQAYIINGAIVSLLLEVDVDPKEKRYSRAIQRGFLPCDKNVLKSLMPKIEIDVADRNKKLTQKEIDDLLDRYK